MYEHYEGDPFFVSVLWWINRTLLAVILGLVLFLVIHALGYIDLLGRSEQSFTWHEITGFLNLVVLVFFLVFPKAYKRFLTGIR